MLVMTRMIGERIFLNENVVITLVSALNGKARIGVSAPKDIIILREEVFRSAYGDEKADEILRIAGLKT